MCVENRPFCCRLRSTSLTKKLVIYQVMTVCKENRLYDAIIHIHNKAMLDYTGPIEEMVDIVAAPLNEKREPNYAEIEVKILNTLDTIKLICIFCCR